jgi:hypothetical protein
MRGIEKHKGHEVTREQAEHHIESLTEVISDILTMAGSPNDARLIMLTVEFINDYYKGVSAEEVKRAYNMAISGKLDSYFDVVRGQIDKHYYGKINTEYFGKVLTAYKRMKLALAPKKKYKELPRSRESEIKAREYTRKSILEQYENYLNGKDIEFIIPFHINNIMSRIGLSERSEATKDEVKNAIHSILSRDTASHYDRIGAVRDREKNRKVIATANQYGYLRKIREAFEKVKRENLDLEKLLKTMYDDEGNKD